MNSAWRRPRELLLSLDWLSLRCSDCTSDSCGCTALFGDGPTHDDPPLEVKFSLELERGEARGSVVSLFCAATSTSDAKEL